MRPLITDKEIIAILSRVDMECEDGQETISIYHAITDNMILSADANITWLETEPRTVNEGGYLKTDPGECNWISTNWTIVELWINDEQALSEDQVKFVSEILTKKLWN